MNLSDGPAVSHTALRGVVYAPAAAVEAEGSAEPGTSGSAATVEIDEPPVSRAPPVSG
jgi:hypothetical protein